MDNQQLNSNLNELIKNQIEICEKLDKMDRKIKKLIKPKKESNYDLNNIFGNLVEQLDKINFKQVEPKQDQKYYLCIKDIGLIKEGNILKNDGFCTDIKTNVYTIYSDGVQRPHLIYKSAIDGSPENFIPIQQFETLKEGQEIEFTLRNGWAYKAKVHVNIDGCHLAQPSGIYNDQPFKDLNQYEFKNILNKKYGNIGIWPNAPTLEDLTIDLNKLITLPDLSKEIKTDQNESLEKQANELIDKFMPLVNGWKSVESIGYVSSGGKQWIYNTWCQRQAAIKCAIVHCELNDEVIKFQSNRNNEALKSQLQKMLSE